MDYGQFVQDFAKRSQRNLELIESAQKQGKEAYEVTQLINSCLGLLVLPQQAYYDSIPETPLEQLIEEGWHIPPVQGDFKQVKNLKQLMRYLRNAVAHCNMEVLADSNNQIETLVVWNMRDGNTTWKASLGIKELRSILYKFTALLNNESIR